MNHQKNDDEKLEKFLKEAKGEVPKAPANELSVLMKRIESTNAKYQQPTPAGFGFIRYASAIAACLVLIATALLWNKNSVNNAYVFSEEESIELETYAYNALEQIALEEDADEYAFYSDEE